MFLLADSFEDETGEETADLLQSLGVFVHDLLQRQLRLVEYLLVGKMPALLLVRNLA